MTNLFSFGLNILADVFYPKYCFSCKRAGSYLCKFCVNQVPTVTQSFCIVCNKPSLDGWTHPHCKTQFSADRLVSALPYKNSVVSDMVITGKYYFIPECFAVLAALTANHLLLNGFEEEVADFIICPIPLHPQRLRWRGFNQSEVAGKILSQALHIPCINILKRTKKTEVQKNLDAKSRKTNMQNAFACVRKSPKKVLLIDDVTTTGQTLSEAARVLKQNGAQAVWCISLAKD